MENEFLSYCLSIGATLLLALGAEFFWPDAPCAVRKQRKKQRDDVGQKPLRMRQWQVAFCRLCEKFLSDQGTLEKHEKDKLHMRNLAAGFAGQVYELLTEREVAKKRESLKLRQGHILKEGANQEFTL